MRKQISALLTLLALALLWVASAGAASSRTSPTYAWTTLVGGPGLWGTIDGTGVAARFDEPCSVVADTCNNTIQKVSSSGVVTTLAGLAGTADIADGTASYSA